MASNALPRRGSHARPRTANDGSGRTSRAESGYVGAALGFLAIVLLLGGGGVRYPLVEAAIEALAVAMIAWTIVRLRGAAVGGIGGAMLALAALALLLPLIQLVPLPWSVWSALPGHDRAASIYRLLGWEGRWHPLTLTPDGTRTTILAQLPAVAVLLSVLTLDWRQRLAAMRVVVGVALTGVMVAALQIAAGPDAAPLLYETAHRSYGVGLFVNRNHQATLLLVAIVLAMVPGVLMRDRGGRGGMGRTGVPMAAMVVVLLTLGVLATASRTGLLLLGPTIAAAVLPVAWRGRVRRWLPGAVAVGALGAIGLYFTPLVQGVLARFATVAEDDRYRYWDNSRFALGESMPWGTGFGSFQTIYPVVEPLEQVSPLIVPHAHSDYLELAMEGGVPALALALAGLVLAAVALVAALRAEGTAARRVAATGAAIGIVVVLAGSAVDFPLRMSALLALFALLFALLAPPAMLADTARRRHGRVLPVVLGVIALAVAWQGLTQGLAGQMLLTRQGAAAVRIAPWSSRAWSMHAAQQPLPRGADAAAAAARRALAIAPMDAVAVRVAGLADIARGDGPRGQALLRFGAQLGWRDVPTQLWLVQEAIGAGAIDFALERIDALLRQGQMGPLLYAQMDRLVVLPEGRRAIAARLADRPGWRQGFLNALDATAPGRVDAVHDLLRAMARAGVPADPAAIRLILWRLSDAGDRAGVLRLWRAAGGTGWLGDGGFDGAAGPLPPGAPPFEWRAVAVNGVQTVVGEPDAPWAGPALEIAAQGGATGTVLAQSLVLPAGGYRLAFASRRSGTPVPFDWAVACTAADGSVATVAVVPGTPVPRRGWLLHAGRVDVPAGCARADLTLRIGQAGGGAPSSLWIDGVALVRDGD